jgi:hypothetical protein
MKYISCLTALLVISTVAFAQKMEGRLKFEQGQVIDILLEVKTTISQQAMGQAIDFNMAAAGEHSYKVTNTTEDNSTLHHQVQQIRFSFDGMGQKSNFDSKEEKDLNGRFGKPIKELLEKKYDMVIDPNGKTLMVIPEKIELSAMDSRMAIITSLMKDVFELVQPPRKGTASFFQLLPDSTKGIGDTWVTTYTNENGNFDAAYKIADINDSTIVVDFATSSLTITKAEMMGNPTTTTMNNKSAGKIIIDRNTGILKEKNETVDSNGNTETSFGTLPVTSKTTIKITTKKPG